MVSSHSHRFLPRLPLQRPRAPHPWTPLSRHSNRAEGAGEIGFKKVLFHLEGGVSPNKLGAYLTSSSFPSMELPTHSFLYFASFPFHLLSSPPKSPYRCVTEKLAKMNEAPLASQGLWSSCSGCHRCYRCHLISSRLPAMCIPRWFARPCSMGISGDKFTSFCAEARSPISATFRLLTCRTRPIAFSRRATLRLEFPKIVQA